MNEVSQFLKDHDIPEWRPRVLGMPVHTAGLPAGSLVPPGWSPIDGLHTIVVTKRTVSTYTLSFPTNHNVWNLRNCQTYESPNEMIEIVKQIIESGDGPW